MEHHLIRFPPSDFYGSAEMFAQMYPDGMPTIWSLMNLAKTTNVADARHTPMIHEGPLFVFMIIILVVAILACGCSALTTFFGFILYAFMGIVGNAFHMSFHVRGFHLEKYKWYLELRTLHYIHHLGDMKKNFAMINLGFESVFLSLAVEDPATKVSSSAPALPEGVTRETLRRATQHFGISGVMLGMNTPDPAMKTSPGVSRGYPTVLLRILITGGAVYVWYLTEEYVGDLPVRTSRTGDVYDPLHEWAAWGEGRSPGLVMILCAISCVVSELIVTICILASIIGTTFRPFLSIIITFVIRVLIRLSGALQHMSIPESVWQEPPHMPHLFVQHAPTSHLFFSGRVALATIACCELIELSLVLANPVTKFDFKRAAVVGLGFVLLLWTIWLSLAFRASWSYDCLIAFIVARHSSTIAARCSKRVDAFMP